MGQPSGDLQEEGALLLISDHDVIFSLLDCFMYFKIIYTLNYVYGLHVLIYEW